MDSLAAVRRPTLAQLTDDPALTEAVVFDLWDRLGPATVAAGREWYPAAHRIVRAMAEARGLPVGTVAAVVAVLSPMLRWAENIPAAAAILDGLDHPGPLPANVEKARRILAGGDVRSELGKGGKVPSFGDDLLLRDHHWGFGVTIDTWMVRALTGDPTADYKAGANGGTGMTIRRYRCIARAIVTACKRMGVEPRAWQAAVWLAVGGGDERPE